MKPARIFAQLLGATLLGTGAWLVFSIQSGQLSIPTRFDPWAALIIDEPVNFLTRHKLDRLSADEAQCRAVLATANVTYEPLEDRVTGESCGFRNAVRIERTSATAQTAFSLSCPAAVSLALWERHVLQPQALAYFNQPVVRIDHFGSYACRNVYGRATGARSRHATADAFDIAGFRLADGTRIRVVNDWQTKNQTPTRMQLQSAAFLHTIRDGACGFFDAVLSPDYNAAHHDHLHVDRGRYRACR